MDDLTELPADAPWWAKWLVENWRAIAHEFSSWFLWAIGALAAAAEFMPMWLPEAKQYLSGPTLHYAIAACALAGFLSKYIKQKDPSASAATPAEIKPQS